MGTDITEQVNRVLGMVTPGRPAGAPARRGRGKSLKNLELIQAAKEILAEIQPASVRAVCYQLFNRRLLPDMSVKSTKRVSVQLTWAREQGEIPWAWIVDATRSAVAVPSWDDPEEYALEVVRNYRRDWWTDQGVRVEIWSEKGTVEGTLGPVLSDYGVVLRTTHGFNSTTASHKAARYAVALAEQRVPLVVLYVGDWDPSGLYMSEVDLPGRLAEYGAEVGPYLSFGRVALTRADTQALASQGVGFSAHEKSKDARYGWFVSNHGQRCWELDAMSPVDLRARVAAGVQSHIRDSTAWDRSLLAQRVERASLVEVLAKWRKAPSGA